RNKWTTANGSALDGREIEPTEPVWISQDVDLNDLPARNRDAEHGKQAPIWKVRHDANVAIHEDHLIGQPDRGSRAGALRRPSDPGWARSPRRSSQTHRGARTPVVPPAPASRGQRAVPDRQSRRAWRPPRALRPQD